LIIITIPSELCSTDLVEFKICLIDAGKLAAGL
jgi:hypothetical protein